jgi:hypothetical protein
VNSYLSICSVYRDEAPYLAEWIEFHRLVGVERFFLYDNRSRDSHLDVLAPYIEDGIVVLHDWPEPLLPDGQRNAYNHCIEHHGDETRWMAIIDSGDNFVFSPSGRPLSEVLPEYEPWPAVGVQYLNFGNSGHRTKPAGLVTESYVHRAKDPEIRLVKLIVDPARVERVLGDMRCLYSEGFAVDENKEPLADNLYAQSRSYSKLRLNHYARKSDKEFERALALWAELGMNRQAKSPEKREQRGRELNEVRDEEILRYVPALKQALARRSTRPVEPVADRTNDLRS